jgi:hypothetical protein
MGWDIYGVTHVKNNRYSPHFLTPIVIIRFLILQLTIVLALSRMRRRIAPHFFASIVS